LPAVLAVIVLGVVYHCHVSYERYFYIRLDGLVRVAQQSDLLKPDAAGAKLGNAHQVGEVVDVSALARLLDAFAVEESASTENVEGLIRLVANFGVDEVTADHRASATLPSQAINDSHIFWVAQEPLVHVAT